MKILLNKGGLWHYCTAVMLVFAYIYSIHLWFLPVGLPILLGALFLVYFVVTFKARYIGLDSFYMLLMLLGIVSVTFVSCAINGTQDFEFIKTSILTIIIFAAARGICDFISTNKKPLTFERLANLFIIVALIQAVLSLVFFINKPLMESALSLLQYSELAVMKIEQLLEFRLIGFGVQFFTAGVIYGFVLMLITAMVSRNSFNIRQNLCYFGAWVLIFVVGMLTARTTLVGAGLSALLLLPNKYNQYKLSRVLKAVVLFFALFIILISMLPSDILLTFEEILPWAFEMFINYFDSGSATTASTDAMINMYIFPDSFWSWIIGDGRWIGDNGFGYYMSTDIGYSRLFFYFGMTGFIAFVVFEVCSIFFTSKRNSDKYYAFFMLVIVYLFMILLKGYYSMFALIIPFYFVKKRIEIRR